MKKYFIRYSIGALLLSFYVPIHAAEDDSSSQPAVTPQSRAHAHNDYYHDRPLLDALDQGFCSVEADIFLVDGKLLVGHSRSEVRPERSLEGLYLIPLKERVDRNGGRVYPGHDESVILLVDIKGDGEQVYSRLKSLLEPYRQMLTSYEGEKTHRRAVTLILSGDRPQRMVAADRSRLVAIDGRPSDLTGSVSAQNIPLISQSWGALFSWNGKGPIPEADAERIGAMVESCHGQGRMLRFWGTPDRVEVWRHLHTAGVDLINTDRLEELARFLQKQSQ
jgi:hypothetical protein